MTSIRTLLCIALLVISSACVGAGLTDEGALEQGLDRDDSAVSEQAQETIGLQTDVMAQPIRPWDCTDDGHICCQGLRCCAWSPDLGWVCIGGVKTTF
jgi:hypothetical protein